MLSIPSDSWVRAMLMLPPSWIAPADVEPPPPLPPPELLLLPPPHAAAATITVNTEMASISRRFIRTTS